MSTFDPWDGLPRVQMVLWMVVLGSTIGYQQRDISNPQPVEEETTVTSRYVESLEDDLEHL
jgi:hypothetical protein